MAAQAGLEYISPVFGYMKPVITGSSQATFLHDGGAGWLTELSLDEAYGIFGARASLLECPSLVLIFADIGKN